MSVYPRADRARIRAGTTGSLLPYQAVPYRSFTFHSVPFRLPVPWYCG